MVCIPTATHADFTIAAAKEDKHIFCEKPIDLSVKKGLEAIKAAKAHNVSCSLASTAASTTISVR